MNKYLPLFLPLIFAAGGCSESADTTSKDTSAVSRDKSAPVIISKENPFSTQVDALNAAKATSAAAQKSIDSSQKNLQESTGY